MIQGPTPSQLLIRNLMLGIRDPKQNDGQEGVPFTEKEMSDIARVIYAKVPPEQLFADLSTVFSSFSPVPPKALKNVTFFVKQILKNDVAHEFHDKTVDLFKSFARSQQLPETLIQEIDATSDAVKKQKSRQEQIISVSLPSGQTDVGEFINVRLKQDVTQTETKRTVSAMVSDLRQMQLGLFRNLSPSDFYNKKWDKDKDKKLAIGKMIKSYNGLASMIVDDIVMNSQEEKHQMRIFDFYSRVAQECVRTGDFQSGAAIFGALNNSAVSRFKFLMEQPGLAKIHEELNVVFSPLKANKGLREEIAQKKEAGVSVIPWVGIPMQDMFATEETPTEPTSEDKLKNISAAMSTIFEAQNMAFAQVPKPLESTLGQRVKQHEAANTQDEKAREKMVSERSLSIMPRGETQPRAAYFHNPQAANLAKELTDRHGALMMKIDPHEIKKWVKTPEQAPNFVALINELQNLVNMVRDDIMMATSESSQVERFEFYVQLLVECERNKNYAAMRAISAGLNSEAVSRLQYLQSAPFFETLKTFDDHENGLLSNKSDKAKMKERLASEEGFFIPDISVTKFKVEIAANYDAQGKVDREKAAIDEFKSWQDRTGMKYDVNSPVPQGSLSERYQQLPLDGDFAAQRSQQIYKVNGTPFENAPVTLAGIIRENESVVFNKIVETIKESNKTIEQIIIKSAPDKPFWHEDSGRRLEQVKSALAMAQRLKESTSDENLKIQVVKAIQKLEGNLNKLEEQKVNSLKPFMQEFREQFDGIAYLAGGNIETTDIKGYQEPSAKFNAQLEKLIGANLSHVPEISALINEATAVKMQLDSMMSAANSLPLMQQIREEFDSINYLATGLFEGSSLEGYKENRDSFNRLIEKLQGDNPVPHPAVAALLQEAISVRDNFDANVAVFTSRPLMEQIREEIDTMNYLATGLFEGSSLEGYKEQRDSFNRLIDKLQSANPIPHPEVVALLQEAIAVRDNFDKNVAAVSTAPAVNTQQSSVAPAPSQATPKDDKGKEEAGPAYSATIPRSVPTPAVPQVAAIKQEASKNPTTAPVPTPAAPQAAVATQEPSKPATPGLIDEVWDLLEKTGELTKMKATVAAKAKLAENDIRAHLAPNKVFELRGPQVRVNENGKAFLAFRIDRAPKAQSFCEALKAMNIDCTAPRDLKDKGVQVITMDAQQLLAILKDKNGAGLLKGNYERIMGEKGAQNLLSPRADAKSTVVPPTSPSAPPTVSLPPSTALEAIAKKLQQEKATRTTGSVDVRTAANPRPLDLTAAVAGGPTVVTAYKRERFVSRDGRPIPTVQELQKGFLNPLAIEGQPQSTASAKSAMIPKGIVAQRAEAFKVADKQDDTQKRSPRPK